MRAAVLPGGVQEVGIKEFRRIPLGEEVAINNKPCLMALDGERELLVSKDANLSVRIERDGPLVVDIIKTVRQAVGVGFFQNTRVINNSSLIGFLLN